MLDLMKNPINLSVSPFEAFGASWLIRPRNGTSCFLGNKKPLGSTSTKGLSMDDPIIIDRKIDLPLSSSTATQQREYYHTFFVKRSGKLFYGEFYLLPVSIVVILP